MSGDTKQLSAPARIQVTLDGEPVAVSCRPSATLANIRNELEMMALRRERVVSSLVVNGVAVDMFKFGTNFSGIESVEAETTGFGEMGRFVVASARNQLSELIAEMQNGALLVLINEGPATGQLWQEWERGLRTVLLRISFLHELQPARVTGLIRNGIPFTKFIDSLSPIICGVQLLVWDQMDASSSAMGLALSDVIEERLLGWLREFDVYLEELHGDQI